MQAQVAARIKAKAEAERRKKDDIFGSIKKYVGDKLDYIQTYSNTSGVCVSGSAVAGIGAGGGPCFMLVGDDYAFAWVTEAQVGPEVGGGFTLDFVRSNADDISQVRGMSSGLGGTGGPLSASHRGTFNTRNSRGDTVHSFTGSIGPSLGLGGSAGTGNTKIATVGTVAGEVGDFLKFW